MYVIYAIIAITFIVSLIVTPKVIKWSIKHNIVDIPKDSRRIHSKPMPRIGGLAIVISMVVGFLIYFLFTKDIESIALGKKFLGYAIGAFFIFLMGFIDDVYGLRARYKFWFQLAAAIVVFAFGLRTAEPGVYGIYLSKRFCNKALFAFSEDAIFTFTVK